MTRGDQVFLDTNVLLEATDTRRRHYDKAHEILAAWPEAGIDLFVSGQVIREYLVVATRPVAGNGLGLATADALENVRRLRSRLAICPETENVCSHLQRLASRLDTTGKRFHDLNIAATAKCAGLQKIVTANPSDFPTGIELEIIPLADARLVG